MVLRRCCLLGIYLTAFFIVCSSAVMAHRRQIVEYQVQSYGKLQGLLMIARGNLVISISELKLLTSENNELISIFVTSISTTKHNAGKS